MDVHTRLQSSQYASDSLANTSRKKILYFSDGALEVDEDAEGDSVQELEPKPLPVNSQRLPWFPWMWHHTVNAGSKALEVCDYVGESLASFFGITTPKYQFEINEYLRLQKEESKNEIEMGSWTKANDDNNFQKNATEIQPKVLYSARDSNFIAV